MKIAILCLFLVTVCIAQEETYDDSFDESGRQQQSFQQEPQIGGHRRVYQKTHQQEEEHYAVKGIKSPPAVKRPPIKSIQQETKSIKRPVVQRPIGGQRKGGQQPYPGQRPYYQEQDQQYQSQYPQQQEQQYYPQQHQQYPQQQYYQQPKGRAVQQEPCDHEQDFQAPVKGVKGIQQPVQQQEAEPVKSPQQQQYY